MKSLRELYAEHSGKVSDKWSIYLDLYDRILSAWRTKPVELLEIGIQNGGSLDIWARYFESGKKFVGCDINPSCALLVYRDPRISVVVGDANRDETEASISTISERFDIIIDDGSHTLSDVVRSFLRYWPRLRYGGVFAIEDLHCSYWQEYEGGVHHPWSSINFLKLLVDLVNHEHWGLTSARLKLIQSFLSRHQCEIPEEQLACIQSITFANSLCFITKEPVERNELGGRVIAGTDEAVVPGHCRLAGQPLSSPSQTTNPYSVDLTPPAQLLARAHWEIDRQRATAIRLSAELAAERSQKAEALARAAEAEEFSQRIVRSRGWRALDRLRTPIVAYRRIRDRMRPAPSATRSDTDLVQNRNVASKLAYEQRVRQEADALAEYLPAILETLRESKVWPRISVLMPVYNAQETHLRRAIESVLNQLYGHWELCIADDCSTDPKIRAILQEYANRDDRIRVVYRSENGHISAATNSALEVASGEFVALLDHDDELHPLALYRIGCVLSDDPEIDLIYTDEDKIDAQGRRSDPYFKCDFNYELLLSHNMICHLGVYRRSTALAIGGFRLGFEGAQDYDFALRFLETIGTARVKHIPEILYHWRMHEQSTAAAADAKPYAVVAAERAIQEHLNRVGLKGEVGQAPEAPGMHRVRFSEPQSEPSVDIVIPTRDRADLLSIALSSIFGKTQYDNFQVIVVDNGSQEKESLDLIEEWVARGRVRVLRVDEPFNFSRLNNVAVQQSKADLVCLLNNDIEIIEGDWLREMVSHAIRPGVGCVGARLWYPDGTLQHGGVVLGIGGVAGHAHKRWPRGDAGYFGRAVLLQSFSAVTAACLMVRREIFDQVGGLDEKLRVAFNDVDFCLRVRKAGYRNVWTPYAQLVHHESVSRGLEDNPEKQRRFSEEVAFMKERWGKELVTDPMYSVNLTLEREDFGFR
ncbi:MULTISPECIES: glycosyltransferase [Ramlibacter]|uniref:Glycosyltransferase n=1 Tax=Ramlibacter aquaticus TaxID=2780094 RepID=A0ABR9SJP7_9BURK|nr:MULTISPECIES: glycosyltransferase [Ramlibacter]MBE7942570.1 glycosyltransferase [Ramlibacter aquaticus]